MTTTDLLLTAAEAAAELGVPLEGITAALAPAGSYTPAKGRTAPLYAAADVARLARKKAS
jgi:hypothetical protein